MSRCRFLGSLNFVLHFGEQAIAVLIHSMQQDDRLKGNMKTIHCKCKCTLYTKCNIKLFTEDPIAKFIFYRFDCSATRFWWWSDDSTLILDKFWNFKRRCNIFILCGDISSNWLLRILRLLFDFHIVSGFQCARNTSPFPFLAINEFV